VKKPVLITILALFCVGGFLLYNHYFNPKSINPWDLIPEETILVYESGNCKSCVEETRNSPVAKIIATASFPARQNDSLSVLQDFLLSFQQPTLISLHTTKKDQFDFAFYFRITSAFNKKISMLLQPLYSGKQLKKTQREFQDITINEIDLKGSVFSWIEYQDVWVGSFSPVIIEDVIRTTTDPEHSFKNKLGEVYQGHTVKNDAGNIFIHLKNLTQWFSLFTAEAPPDVIQEFGHAALLDSKISEGKFILNGFCSQSADNKTFLSTFSDQQPVALNLKNIISNRAILVSSYGISDGKKFFERANEKKKNPHADSLRIIFKEFNEDPSKIYDNLTGEIATCYLEGRNESLVKVLIIQDQKNITHWEKLFNKASETTTADTVFVDVYSNYQIHEIPLYRFPEKVFYPLVNGFDNGYYARVGSALCIAEDIQELKSFLSDIDQENTWGKSVAQNRFLESTLLESNISLFVNTPRIWSMLGKSLQPKWQKFISDNDKMLSSLGMGAIQFSHLSENYYTNVSFMVKEQVLADKRPAERLVTIFESGASNMWLVDNHNDKSKEVLIQDSLKNLHLVSTDGKALWKLPLDNFIQGNVEQIDFLANGKLQYFFATAGKLHLVDRNGNYVAPYPISISENKTEFVNVLDYDHSKKYRFLISSWEGRLWMYDKQGKNLEGWQPRSVDESLISGANHHRMVGKDYLLAIRKDGVVFLMNRRGETIPNFPLTLGAKLSGGYFINTGKNAASTIITVVSADGTKIKFNIQGKIISKEVLVKNALDSKFSLCSERNNKSYVVIRQEPKQFTVFDENGNEIIKSDYISNSNVDVRYYSFGSGRTYIVVTDRGQELSYIFDKTGKLVSPLPIESSTIEILPEDNGKVKVFSIIENSLTMRSIP
jgi:hypothetical protein